MAMITTLLPQLVNSDQTAKFLEFNMDDEEKLVLRVAMGPLYNVFNTFIGAPDRTQTCMIR